MLKTVSFFFMMFLLSCMGQVSSDVYLPALPLISTDLKTTVHAVQLTVALYYFGFAVSHLVYGPISDSTGRKLPLMIGIFICIVGTVMCQTAHTIAVLDAGRFIQGLGAGAAATIYRSILSDCYHGPHLSKVSSFLDISRIFLLASSPLIGAFILHWVGGWRSCFEFLLLYCSIGLVGTIVLLRETNEHRHMHKIAVPHIAKNVLKLLKSGVFMGNTMFVMLTYGGILCWLTTLPIVLQTTMGLSAIGFGGVSALAGLFFMVGGVANALLVGRFGLSRMLYVGFATMLFGGLSMLTFGLLGYLNIYVVMVPVILFIMGSSMVFPNAYAGAFQPFKEMAGTASAVFGFLQILGGAISSLIMSYMHTYNQIPLAGALIVIPVIGITVLTALVSSAKQERLTATV